jgi:glycine cleavage system H lipoate-binding protein
MKFSAPTRQLGPAFAIPPDIGVGCPSPNIRRGETNVAILFIVSVLLLFLTIDLVVAKLQGRRFHRTMGAAVEADAKAWHIQEPGEGVLVHDFHTWVAEDDSGAFRLGVDGFAGALLGGVERVTPCVQAGPIEEGAPLAVITGLGRAVTLFAPLAGEVVGLNPALSPQALTKDPLGQGWILQIRAKRPPRAGAFWRGKDALRRWWREEFLRLREAALAAATPHATVGVSLADGGAPLPGSFGHLDPVAFADLVRSTFGAQAATPSPAPLALVTERAST